VSYSPNAAKEEPNGLPALYGLDLADRTAIIISGYDLSCGWDNHSHEGKLAYGISDANRLGVNMVAYSLAYHKLGLFLAKNKIYFQDEEPSRGDFIFAQIKHEGSWDNDPSAAANLLKTVKASGDMNVKFKRVSVDLETAELFSYPFLYITGHDDFTWTGAETKKLRQYIKNGGFLLADSCCGREAFTNAFRREIKKVFPDNDLKRLEAGHAAYNSRYKVRTVKYTPYLAKLQPKLSAPTLEGIAVEGATRVIFSPYDLGNGWEGVDHPFTKGYAAKDALRLGVNIINYAMTH
jgi:hypothetical protein